MGSSGSKKRKTSKPMPTVGSQANERYEMAEERHRAFGNLAMVAIAALLILGVLGLLVLTL